MIPCLSRMLKESIRFYFNLSLFHYFASFYIEKVIQSLMNPIIFYQYFWKKFIENGVFIPDLSSNSSNAMKIIPFYTIFFLSVLVKYS